MILGLALYGGVMFEVVAKLKVVYLTVGTPTAEDTKFLCDALASLHNTNADEIAVETINLTGKSFEARGKCARKEAAKGQLIIADMSTGEAFRTLRQCLIADIPYYILHGDRKKRSLRLINGEQDTTVWPKKERQRLVTRETSSATMTISERKPERIPYRDD